ncbi:unnamed protein product [Caenorhabditis brenneri]
MDTVIGNFARSHHTDNKVSELRLALSRVRRDHAAGRLNPNSVIDLVMRFPRLEEIDEPNADPFVLMCRVACGLGVVFGGY